MAHAQKPDLVFQRNGRVHLNRRGCQFSRLLAAEECGSAISYCIDRVPTYSGRSAGYPLHSHLSPSLPLPCVTVCHQVPNAGDGTGVAHRITLGSVIFFLFYDLFIFYSWYNKRSAISSKTTRSFLGNWHSHFSVLPPTILIRDCFRTALLGSVICSQPFLRLNLSLYKRSYRQQFRTYVDRWNPKRTAMNRP